MSDERWYAIRSATRQEGRAYDALAEQGFRAYVPKETRWLRSRLTKTKVERPLFPGYLFVCCSPDDFYRVVETDGVHQFVRVMRNTGELAPMAFPDDAIGDLISQQHFGEFDATRSKPKRTVPKNGDRAAVVSGKWRGYFAEVLATSPKHRMAVVMLETINAGRVKMTLDAAHLDAA